MEKSTLKFYFAENDHFSRHLAIIIIIVLTLGQGL